MALDNHVRRFHPFTLGFFVFIATIELIIAAWLQVRYNSHHNYPSISVRDRNTFLLFTSAWTIFVSVLFIIFFERSVRSGSAGSILASAASHIGTFFLTWLFWLAGAASITESLHGGVNCSAAGLVYCNQLMALMAFAWIGWAVATVFLLVVLAMGIRTARRGNGFRGQLIGNTY